MSDEAEKLIDDVFLHKCGVQYPFVRAPGVNDQYGIKFFPSVYCIAPDGRILTIPDDRMPAESFLEEQLKNVSLAPSLPDDPRFDAIRSFWQKKDYQHLRDYLDKMLAQEHLDADLRPVLEGQRAELHKRCDRLVARAEELGKGPDFCAAQEQLAEMEKEWHGLPPGEASRQQLDRFAKDGAIRKELAAGKALEHLLASYDPTRLAQRRKLREELAKFGKRYEGTYAAGQARSRLEGLN